MNPISLPIIGDIDLVEVAVVAGSVAFVEYGVGHILPVDKQYGLVGGAIKAASGFALASGAEMLANKANIGNVIDNRRIADKAKMAAVVLGIYAAISGMVDQIPTLFDPVLGNYIDDVAHWGNVGELAYDPSISGMQELTYDPTVSGMQEISYDPSISGMQELSYDPTVNGVEEFNPYLPADFGITGSNPYWDQLPTHMR